MFDKYFSLDSNNTVSYIRTFINYGLPLEIGDVTYKNKTDRRNEQQEYIKVFARMVRDKLSERYGDGSGDKPMRSTF